MKERRGREEVENFRRTSARGHFACQETGRGAINSAGGVINFFRENTKSALTRVSATGQVTRVIRRETANGYDKKKKTGE